MTEREEVLENALRYALGIIEAYQCDIRNPQYAGVEVDLVNRGFCQGVIYRDAVPKIKRVLNEPGLYVDLEGTIRELP